jgi:hypothetical protein
VEDHVVGRWLERGTRFFRAITRNPVIRGVLLQRGLTTDELARGWELYSRVFGLAQSPAAPPQLDTAAADAMNELDAWDGPAYRVIRSVLGLHDPTVERFLFDGVRAGEGPEAVSSVERFLTNVGQLKEGRAEGIDDQRGRAALALLAERKLFTDADAQRLRELFEITKQGAPPAPLPPPEDPTQASAVEDYVKWISEWREVARFAIHRRDYLISLGLAHRKPAQSTDDSAAEDDGSAEASA